MTYKAYVFDAYGTLFDVHSVMKKIHQFFPDQGPKVSEEWRSRQVHYFLVRQLIQGYKPFTDITRWALLDALAYSNVDVKPDVVDDLMHEYEQLQPYDEVPSLKQNHQDKTFTIFSNGTRSMLEPLLENNQLKEDFNLLSADDVEVYKPHPNAYSYAHEQLGFEKEEILFFSSNPWDITGAASYGFHTAWVNRKQQKWPELGINPTHIISNLNEIPD
ncbi:haloacid dehalogenase type II [Halobacillus trueperi]|uniref:2-haloacid dehalogenase n=2 Tax=Halobacillus TaxID=45667 RepID=A0A1H0HL43_HALAD|nr:MULTISPECIES: haloacid dehalogenase type II [Halobacillus]RDY70427.1 haloacid dehalogenase type II [Halobacillus trueperi]SDO19928.1 2-haloacid dehalogenase [Halobacillus aidingensis]